MRRIFKVKARKEDPSRYINANNEQITSTYEKITGYITGGMRWVKRIIHTNDENSALPGWITQSIFYSKPQIINRVYKRKLPQHLEGSLDLISKGFTPTNLAIQLMKHEKIVQERKRVQAIEAALQRRRIIQQQEYDKPKKIYQRFTISYIEDKKKPYEQDFVDKKITLALDLLRQQIDKKEISIQKQKTMAAAAAKATSNTPKLAQIDKKVVKQQNKKPNDGVDIQIEKPAISPIQIITRPTNKEDIASKSNNPFLGTISRNIGLSQLINSSKQPSQFFKSKPQIEEKRQEQIPSNNNENQHFRSPLTNLFSHNGPPYSNSQFQQTSISVESNHNGFPFPQNNMNSNDYYGNRNINNPPYSYQRQQQNLPSNPILPSNNQISFTNDVDPKLLNNGSARDYFQSQKKSEVSIFGFEQDNHSQSGKTTKKSQGFTRSKARTK